MEVLDQNKELVIEIHTFQVGRIFVSYPVLVTDLKGEN